jgi:hypothetical protein
MLPSIIYAKRNNWQINDLANRKCGVIFYSALPQAPAKRIARSDKTNAFFYALRKRYARAFGREEWNLSGFASQGSPKRRSTLGCHVSYLWHLRRGFEASQLSGCFCFWFGADSRKPVADSRKTRDVFQNQEYVPSDPRFPLTLLAHDHHQASASYFACVIPATTAASLSSIWFQPSN